MFSPALGRYTIVKNSNPAPWINPQAKKKEIRLPGKVRIISAIVHEGSIEPSKSKAIQMQAITASKYMTDAIIKAFQA